MKTKFTSYLKDTATYIDGSLILKEMLKQIDGKFKHVFHLNKLSSIYYQGAYKDLDDELFDVDLVFISDSLYFKFLTDMERDYYLNRQRAYNNYNFYTKLIEAVKSGEVKVLLPFGYNGVYTSPKLTYTPNNQFYVVNMYPFTIEYLKTHPKYSVAYPLVRFDDIKVIYASKKRDYDRAVSKRLEGIEYSMFAKLPEAALVQQLAGNVSIINAYNEPFYRVRFATGYFYGFVNYEIQVTRDEPFFMFPRTAQKNIRELLNRDTYSTELGYQRDVMSQLVREDQLKEALDFLASL